jgi:hypothetical protein
MEVHRAMRAWADWWLVSMSALLFEGVAIAAHFSNESPKVLNSGIGLISWKAATGSFVSVAGDYFCMVNLYLFAGFAPSIHFDATKV